MGIVQKISRTGAVAGSKHGDSGETTEDLTRSEGKVNIYCGPYLPKWLQLGISGLNVCFRTSVAEQGCGQVSMCVQKMETEGRKV